MYKIIDYYRPLEQRDKEDYDRGQIWWTCFPYSFESPRVERYWPNRPGEILDISRFSPRNEKHDPAANTLPGEFLAVCKFKKRPVIILSTSGVEYRDRAWHGGEHFVVAPLRSLRDDITGGYKVNPEFVWGAIRYDYPTVFYAPGDNKFGVHEAVLQLDRIATLHCSWLLERSDCRLTSDAMECLDETIRRYVYGKVRAKFAADLVEYRKLLGDSPQISYDLFGKALK